MYLPWNGELLSLKNEFGLQTARCNMQPPFEETNGERAVINATTVHYYAYIQAMYNRLGLLPNTYFSLVSPRVSQNGTDGQDEIRAILLGDDGSVVLAGYTHGNWSGLNAGEADFAACKLDADGREVWRWQVTVPDKIHPHMRLTTSAVRWGYSDSISPCDKPNKAIIALMCHLGNIWLLLCRDKAI